MSGREICPSPRKDYDDAQLSMLAEEMLAPLIEQCRTAVEEGCSLCWG